MPLQGHLRPETKADYLHLRPPCLLPVESGERVVLLSLEWLSFALGSRHSLVREGLGVRPELPEARLRWDGASLSRPGWGLTLIGCS